MTTSLKSRRPQKAKAVKLVLQINAAHDKPGVAARPPSSPACLIKSEDRLYKPERRPAGVAGALPRPRPTVLLEAPASDFDWHGLLPGKNLLRVQEVAQALDCSMDHVYNLMDEGALKVAVDIRTRSARRGCPRILRASLLDFLQRCDWGARGS